MTSYASLKKARDARKSKRRAPNSTLPAVAPKNQSRKKKLGGPRRKQLPARNSARRKSEFARAYGSKARVRFVATLRCVGCDHSPAEVFSMDNAHIVTGGTGRKADFTKIVPLCRSLGALSCHPLLHSMGRAAFEEWHGVDLDAAAAETQSRWEEHLKGMAS